MRDSRLFDLRIKAEEDKRLCNSGLFILSNIISFVANTCISPDEVFDLPWSRVHKWTGLSQRQCYFWLFYLQKCGYLDTVGLRKQAPTMRQYKLNLKIIDWNLSTQAEKRIPSKQWIKALRDAAGA